MSETFAVMASMAEKDRLRIAELEEDKERLLLMEEHAVQSFNELTRKYEAVEQQLTALREAAQHYCDAQNQRWASQSDEELYRANAGVEQAHDILAALLQEQTP